VTECSEFAVSTDKTVDLAAFAVNGVVHVGRVTHDEDRRTTLEYYRVDGTAAGCLVK
jgi:hypothetical protein